MQVSKKITRIQSNVPSSLPLWAVSQRRLIDTMSQSVHPFAAKYTCGDHSLIWKDIEDGKYESRDGADDFYESFYNWSLLYLLGGDDDLLRLAHTFWDAVTAQLTRYGLVRKEYERGYDQFHQGESYIYFYLLCLADPTNPKLIERARRFAGFYLNEDPQAQNYDPEHKIIRAPHNGSEGPRWGYFDGEPVYGWYPFMEPYGLPYEDVPGVSSYGDLRDPALARRMGEVMQSRMGKGDVATNLIVTSLITNAYLLTGEDKYRRWIIDYVSAWKERARINGGLLPDNVGASGRVGEYIDGKWYGGLYGWSWPHGYYNIGMAAIIAGTNTYLLTGDKVYLDLPRWQIETIHDLGETRRLGDLEMSLGHHWIGLTWSLELDSSLFVVPTRYRDSGWFDYQPPTPIFPVALWNVSREARDWEQIERLRQHSPVDWRQVIPFRTKEDPGHEQPWLMYLKGKNPSYPETIIKETYAQVARRLALIRDDQSDLTQVHIHHWQELNPVTTEALVQLTLGAPQLLYNGGLLHCQVRYFDVDRRRPGLPLDTAALVERIEADEVVVRLVNLNVFETRDLLIQAGAFGEHQFTSVSYDERVSDYPGSQHEYAAPTVKLEWHTLSLDDSLLHVHMLPATETHLKFTVQRYVNPPSYRLPWERLTCS